MSVRLTGAGSVSTATGMAKLKKQFLKDSNPYPPATLINSRATLANQSNHCYHLTDALGASNSTGNLKANIKITSEISIHNCKSLLTLKACFIFFFKANINGNG